MCYDIKASLEAQLARAKKEQDYAAMDEILEKLIPLTDLPLYHASGFSHPELLIYTDRSPTFPEVATWGLVPEWVHDDVQRTKLWNNTLNARGETIFEKPAFRTAANNNRCIIYVDGFYEHHHFKGKTYPFYIYRKDNGPLAFAGLWSEWTTPEGGTLKTFSIVTTTGNPLLAKIHNNPKLKEARMPLILDDENAEEWLNLKDRHTVEKLIRPLPEDLLTAHTVSRLRGKEYMGNQEEISSPVEYSELEF
ncbi:SOS response-associated peptidase [Maribacter polysaccharolyticus]|uniref:SOS response-associated peptidase n=1 Tax=Maribacter polysaccharolyticus TaxID=3020831 RepID=UPI00237F1BA8|nr:SOS response-associated peptidase [Maribacter polysaccharolyticus]MDE3740597.1 SOS response-associated peptidase [Maribacter polysaccharolyticus]